MPRRTGTGRTIDSGRERGVGPDVPLNARDERRLAILKMAEESGERSINAISEHVRQSVREVLGSAGSGK